MRIERIEAEAIAIPLTRDFGGSTYHVTRRCTVITRAYSDEGVVAEVYNGDNRDHAPHIARMITATLDWFKGVRPHFLARCEAAISP